MSTTAEDLIREAYDKRAKVLDLGRCGLTEIPEDVFKMTWLETLNVGNELYYHPEENAWIETENRGPANQLNALPNGMAVLVDLKSFGAEGEEEGGVKLVNIDVLARLAQLKYITLDNNEISDLRPLSGLTQLTRLSLGKNKISDLRPLSGLTQLTGLYLWKNQISDLRPLSELTQLTELYLRENQISDLQTLSGLTQLTELSLWQNQISDLQPLLQLSRLTELHLSQNQISDLQPLATLVHLATLNLFYNRISSIQPLAGLLQLNELDIDENHISDLKPLNNLPELKKLDISNNPISDLSILVPLLRNNRLQEIRYANLPLITPPIEFADEGPTSILEYFEQLGDTGRPLNEIKIIFIGEGAAGKTSLVRCLMGEGFNPKESQTHGIRIRKAEFTMGSGEQVTTHLWDFGGQEVMHATHQFFLSQRSIYVLVLDSRRDERAEYWLKHAQSFGVDSPVLVVLNKIDENPSFDVNRKYLREKYGAIRGFYPISCYRHTGLDELKEALIEQIDQLPLRHTPFPASWLVVKERITNMGKDFIDHARYRNICRRHGVKKGVSQEVLLKFLHDLGVIINFRNLRHLNTQVLNPIWLTKGVYRIINSPIVVEKEGYLHEDELESIINDPRYDKPDERKLYYPPEKLPYIVRVMQEFELCFRLDDRSWIVPQLLPIQEPDVTLNGAVLHFIVSFPEFLPDSIFPRLMVQLHRFIEDNLRWRTGMVLNGAKIFEATARVRADREDKRILIDVSGEERRRFLSFIRETLKEIIGDFADLPFEELVPVADSDVFLDYRMLVEMEKANERDHFVWQLKKKVLISDLLDGVEEESMRADDGRDRVRAFISYSQKDSEYLQELRAALAPLERLNRLAVWDDWAIDAGKEWEKEIFQQLESADIVLCLVSSDFIASDFCYHKELEQAMAAHQKGEKVVIPIRLRACGWEELPIAQLQGTPKYWLTGQTDRDAAWTEVYYRLKPVVEQLRGKKRREKPMGGAS